MSERIYGYDLLRKGGKWLGAARSWLQHKRTTKGVHGDQVKFGDPNARFELGADAIEELAAEVAAAAMNEHGEALGRRIERLEALAQRVLDTEGAGTAAPQPTAEDAGAFYRALQDLRWEMRKSA